MSRGLAPEGARPLPWDARAADGARTPGQTPGRLVFDHKMSEEEAIVNKLLDFEVPRINAESFSKTNLTPIFSDAIGFSRAPISFEIKKLKQDNESMLQCLRGEISAPQARTGPELVHPMKIISDGCWQVKCCDFFCFTLSITSLWADSRSI